ncbi:MAG: ankyrin repeat domain-containing protein [Methylophilaceae bacterium]
MTKNLRTIFFSCVCGFASAGYTTTAYAGHEVPVEPVCPGQRTADMSQAAYDALPPNMRKQMNDMLVSDKAPKEVQGRAHLAWICGQGLALLLSSDNFLWDGSENKPRALTLSYATQLLNAGQIPRDEKGRAIWWDVAMFVLVRNGGQDVSLRPEYYRFFEEKLLPRLAPPVSGVEGDDRSSVGGVIKSAFDMPPDMTLRVITHLRDLGALRWATWGDPAPIARSALKDAMYKRSTATAAYAMLYEASGPDASLLRTAANNENFPIVRRLLDDGIDPAKEAGLLLQQDYLSPAMFQLLLHGAVKLQSNGLLPAAEVNPLLNQTLFGKNILDQRIRVDWPAVDYLLVHGGDMSASFQREDGTLYQTVELFARYRPDDFKLAVSRGLLRLDINYKPLGFTPLINYLFLDKFGKRTYPPPRADVMTAMLDHHNNVNTLAQCDGCKPSYYPLDYAVTFGTPEIVKLLLDRGADPNARRPGGSIVFHRVAVFDRVDVLEMMQHSNKPPQLNMLDANGTSALAWTRCMKATAAEHWLRQHNAPDLGYEACKNVPKNGK